MTSNTQVFPRKVVASAIKCLFRDGSEHLVIGVRHWDPLMHSQGTLLEEKLGVRIDEDQGFVDQYGVFLDRVEALQVVKESGQPFNPRRNGATDELYSEGVW